GLRAVAAQDLRIPEHQHGAHHDAAVAVRPRRGGAVAPRRGLVALRPGSQPSRARNLPPLSPRAGAVEAQARAGGGVRAGDAEILTGLKCASISKKKGRGTMRNRRLLQTLCTLVAVAGCANYATSIKPDERPTGQEAYLYGRFYIEAPKQAL